MPNHCFNRVSFYSDNEEHIKNSTKFLNQVQPYVDDSIWSNHTRTNWADIPLTENDVKEYSFSKPRGEVGEKPIMFEEKQPFRNGLRFKSTDVMDDRWYNWRVHNWGTKWDCYDLSTDDCDFQMDLKRVLTQHGHHLRRYATQSERNLMA